MKKNNKSPNLKNKDIALVVMSCDAYEDVANEFFKLFENYVTWWNSNIYYINETKDKQYKNVTTISTGRGKEWTDRLKYALELIPEKYILYMQEDYLIGKKVDKEDFEYAKNYINENNIWYYKIDNLPKIKSLINDRISYIPSNVRYGINLLTAIINKNELLKRLPDKGISAWEYEASLLSEVTDKYEYNLKGCVLDTKKIIDVHYGVRHGKWMPEVIKFFKKTGSPINTSNRKIMSKNEVVKLKFKETIHHILPTKKVRIIKKILRKLGYKFVSND